MTAFTSQIFTQLTVAPGNLIYHLVLVFSIAGALQSAFNNWRSSEFPQARRAMLGLGMLLLAQILLFLFSGFGWQNIIDSNASLPPLDRAFILFGIIWIIWLWGFPEPSRAGDAAAVLLSLLVAAALALSMLTWPPQAASRTYNTTIDDFIWQAASLTFAALGILVLIIRRPNGYWNGVALLGLGMVGHAGHLLIHPEGNYSGIVRLAYMAGYPLLLTLPQRFPAPVSSAPVEAPRPTSIKQDAGVPERRRYSTDPKTFHALLALAAETNATRVSQAITRGIAQTMLADLCFLIYLTDNKNQLMIAGGYDLIREDILEGGSMNKSMIPMLSNALQRGRPLRMPASSTSADIKGLGEILGLTTPGHILSVPIITPDKDTLGGVLLLSPYSDRTWTADDQAFLANIATSLVPIIQRGQKMSKLENQGEQVRTELAELERRNQELVQQLENARQEASQRSVPSEDLTSLVAAQEEAQRLIEHLQRENAELRSRRDVVTPSPDDPRLQQELKSALQEISSLQNQVEDANFKVLELEKGGHPVADSTDQAEVIASVSQELRQPMSSIIGYTELLLGESVGILGALQRKFVERIKASTERIGSLIDDMIQVTTMETGLAGLHPEAVDLNQIIDNAMSYTSSQVREKNISMHLEIPKTVSAIHADREALQQILIHLLQNAGAATPVEGSISLKVQTQSEKGQEFVLIQVSDSGGGIPGEDLPRVFTRLYRADNVLIQGVGDTGVGLSIAKTLTEAQNGRIWVESEPGVGSTFSVLLPIAGKGEENKPAKTKGKS
jgi:signal transduction histidine kinase